MQQHHELLWTLTGPFKMLGCNIGSRMTVVKLRDGGLFLHSPVAMTDSDYNDLDKLGEVRHIVAPNLMHHLSLPAVASRYPNAKVWGARGIEKKRPDVNFSGFLGESDLPIWGDELKYSKIAGVPMLDEFVFYHSRSETLIVTDLAFNVQKVDGLFFRLCAELNGCYKTFGPSRVFKMSVKDRSLFKSSLIELKHWRFDRIVLAHGEVVETGGAKMLTEAFRDVMQ